MRVQEKMHRINVTLNGAGADLVAAAVKARYPDAEFAPDSDADTVRWDTSELAARIRTMKSPGKPLRAYRQRAGLTVVELSRRVGSKYPNIVAMEQDRRTIGLKMARKLSDALGCEYTVFLDAPSTTV